MTRQWRTPKLAAWQVTLAVGCLLTAVYFAMPGELVQSVGYDVIGLLSVAAVVVGVRRNRPADRATWWMFALASLCSIAADVVVTVYSVRAVDLPVPSIADGLYLIAYPFYIVAVLRLSHQAAGRRSRERWVDAAVVSLGMLALTWQLLMNSYADDSTVGLIGKLTNMAYPIMDIGLLFIVVSAVLFADARGSAVMFIGASMGIMLVGDLGYDLLSQHDAYYSGHPIDVTWLLSYVLIGVAAMHPSMAGERPASRKAAGRLSWMPVIALAGFTAPALILIGDLRGTDSDIALLASVSLIMTALVALRMNWTFERMRYTAKQLLSRTESLQQALLERDHLAADLRHQEFHDGLTGLANRELLQDRLGHALARLERESGMVALMLFDLDGFKNVNDSLGHRAGDTLLTIVAQRMKAMVRPGDTVARLGSDEFAVLMDNVPDRAQAMSVAGRIIDALHEPSDLGDRAVALSASAGVTFGTLADSIEQLLSEADAAMYEAKSGGGNRHVSFEASMRSRVVERLQLTNAFAGALERREFYLEFQPIFALEDGRLNGFEALVRWQHPQIGKVSPLRFISLAEETGFIVPLGKWVLDAACQAAMTWPGARSARPKVAVNVSAHQLQHPGFVSDVRNALARSRLPGSRLVLEVTESVLVRDLDQVVNALRRLKDMGVSVAIDDFGTGYSSLSHLRRFPVDILKIDKSFVDDLDGAATDGRAFVEAIIRLARELRVTVVAEGIELVSQHEALVAMGCEDGQGFLMSRPIDVHAAAELARRAATGVALTSFAQRLTDPAGEISSSQPVSVR